MSAIAMSFESLMTLMAVGWVDGDLDPSEANAVLAAARQSRLPADQMAKLEHATKEPVDFNDLPELSKDERLAVYAMARWIAKADGKVTRAENQALTAMGVLLRLKRTERTAMDHIIAEMGSTDHNEVNLLNLKGAIRKRMMARA
ncbi:MAG: uncharacterized membrane protein YebE (DUF533 family) [Kiritimatiellia bacterium]|jgi:uncharacterized membrane protein YebE (DUF533 family)